MTSKVRNCGRRSSTGKGNGRHLAASRGETVGTTCIEERKNGGARGDSGTNF